MLTLFWLVGGFLRFPLAGNCFDFYYVFSARVTLSLLSSAVEMIGNAAARLKQTKNTQEPA
jgi:hypothetical protein